jgi:methyl-accepting chemotaxis protein
MIKTTLRFRSIIWKIIIPFALLLIFAIVTNLVLSGRILDDSSSYTMKQMENQLSEKGKIVSNITEDNVNGTFQTSIILAEQLSQSKEIVQAFKENNPQLIHTALAKSVKMAKEKANIDLIWFTRLKDRKSGGITPIFACPSNPKFDGFDQLNYKSTNEAMDKGQTVASWEVNEEDGKLQVTTPIFDQGKVIGAIVTGQQTYQPMVAKIAGASNTAATMFLSANQKDIYVMTDTATDDIGKHFLEASHEKLGTKGSALSELAKGDVLYADLLPYIQKSISSSNSFTETVSIQGNAYVMQFKPLITYDGNIVGTYVTRFPGVALEKQKMIDQTRNSQLLLYAIAAILLVISLLISYIVARKIAMPITLVTNRLEAVAEGDLRGDDLGTRSQDEVGRLIMAINSMVGKWRQVISRTRDTAEQVASSSISLAAGALETKQATNQISGAIQNVAEGSEKQVSGSQESTQAMGEIATGIQRIAESSSVVLQSSLDATSMAEQGNQSVNEVVSQMQLIRQSVGATADVISRLGERSQEINEIVTVITDISMQTNLLALNASIEAARAGEHGRGFAVVAGEVKKLAEQSRKSSEHIALLIEEIQNETGRAVDGMTHRIAEVEQGVTVARHTGETFHKILSSIENVSRQIEEVSAVSEQVSASSQQVAASVEDLLSIAKTASNSSQDAAAASEEQLASMEEIAASAQTLSDLAKQLKTHMDTFKV